MSFGQKYDADIPEGHAAAETRDLHPSDRRMRDCGFKIAIRRGDEEPVWRRGDETYTQTEAMAITRLEEKAKKTAAPVPVSTAKPKFNLPR